jgi:Mechanosensitive ion channel, beta-domain
MGGALWEDIKDAIEQTLSFGIDVLKAVLILLGAAIIARILRRYVRSRMVGTVTAENARRIVENAVTLAVYLAAVTLLLTLWGATWSTLLTAIGVSTLFVALGLQGVLQSLVAGIFVLFERPYNVGDHIAFTGHAFDGTVEEIALRTTIVRTSDGTRVVAPNSFNFSQAVMNFSPERAVLIVVTVHGAGGFGRTNEETQALVQSALVDVPGFTAQPDVTVHSRFTFLRVPRLISRIPRVGLQVEQFVQDTLDHATSAKVSWTGLSDPTVREEIARRLHELFPDARVTVRRW